MAFQEVTATTGLQVYKFADEADPTTVKAAFRIEIGTRIVIGDGDGDQATLSLEGSREKFMPVLLRIAGKDKTGFVRASDYRPS